MNLASVLDKCKNEVIEEQKLKENLGLGDTGNNITVHEETKEIVEKKDNVKTELIKGTGIPEVEVIPGFEDISERLNDYVKETATEYDEALTKGIIGTGDITSKRALDLDTKEALKEEIVKNGEHLRIPPERNLEEEKKVKKDVDVIPVHKEVIKIKSRVEETVKETKGLVTKTEVCKEIKKTVEVTEDNKKAWNKIMDKRRKSIKTALVPAVISNAILKGYPLTSNAIINSLQPKSDKSIYQNLTNTLTILANFIEVQGLSELSGYQLSRIISYLDLELLYYVVFKASNDEFYKFNMTCSNPDCAKYGEEVVPVNVLVDDMAHPVDVDKYIGHVSNIKQYTDEADIIKHSPTNIITTIDDVENDREFKIKIPSIFDYIKNVAIKLDDSHDSYQDIINIIPFIHEIVIKDYETETQYVVKEFEDILEILVKYTSDEIITKATEVVDSLVDGRMVEFYIKKEQMVCPICGKHHPTDLAVSPSRMLFLLPEMRKSLEK